MQNVLRTQDVATPNVTPTSRSRGDPNESSRGLTCLLPGHETDNGRHQGTRSKEETCPTA